ncbi:unnamed protein product [Miscanthus lutarioriparius]|uniref:DUF1618 domain-containing protein n=1 Tax=Miscanthus lutarioriparius TaxID=422564 RepID=A0A811PHR0_9POAL|nr:unnamed protein product [Miscanthus lutarioriparius]
MDLRPDWILLNTVAVAGRNSDAITATDCTRYGKTIEVSLSLEHPPHPSILYVHSSDMNPCVPPNIVCAVENLVLVSVNFGSGPSSLSRYDFDYFIYQAHTSGPSLQRLQRPHDPYFKYNGVGLLPRSDGKYTVAALIPTFTRNQYKLYVLHSHTQSWSCRTLCVEVPQEPFPMELPRGSTQLHSHLTSGVITIGGEGGTIGWVDHWRGILLCDVLLEKPSLRGVPIPLPLKELRDTSGKDFPFGPGWQRRGIAFSRDKVLKLVHLEVTATRLPYKDPETGSLSFKVDSWALTTWSNTRMTNSYEDWHQDCTVHASDITIDNPAVSKVLESGLLAGEHLALQNLVMSQPAQCMNGKEDVVCLVARKKHNHPAAWILIVDMKNAKVQAVEEFGTTERQLHSSIIYYPSMISQYMMNPPTTLGRSFPISSKETHEEQLHVGIKPSERPTPYPWARLVHCMQPNQGRRMQCTLDWLAELGLQPGLWHARGFTQPGSSGGDDAEE